MRPVALLSGVMEEEEIIRKRREGHANEKCLRYSQRYYATQPVVFFSDV